MALEEHLVAEEKVLARSGPFYATEHRLIRKDEAQWQIGAVTSPGTRRLLSTVRERWLLGREAGA